MDRPTTPPDSITSVKSPEQYLGYDGLVSSDVPLIYQHHALWVAYDNLHKLLKWREAELKFLKDEVCNRIGGLRNAQQHTINVELSNLFGAVGHLNQHVMDAQNDMDHDMEYLGHSLQHILHSVAHPESVNRSDQ